MASASQPPLLLGDVPTEERGDDDNLQHPDQQQRLNLGPKHQI